VTVVRRRALFAFLTAGTAAAMLALAAPRVRAQEGEEQRLTLHPSIQVSAVLDSNPYFLDRDADPDMEVGGWIYPRLEVAYRTYELDLGADLGAEIRRTIGESSLGDELYRLSGFAELGLLPGLSVRISDAYVPHPARLGRPPDDVWNLLQTNRADLSLRYWRELPQSRELELGIRATHFASEHFPAELPGAGGGAVIAPGFRPNFWQGAAHFEFQSPLGRLDSAYLLGQGGYRAFSDGGRSDHANFSLLLGLRSRRLENAELEVAAGYGLIAFDSLRNQHSVLGNASLQYQFPRGWSGQVSVANAFASNLFGNEVVETTGRIGLEKYFGEHTAAEAGVFIARFEDEALDRDESVYGGADIELRRDLTRHSAISLAYRYWRSDGDDADDDFSQHRLLLQFTYRR
jgi:hypothetical protein